MTRDSGSAGDSSADFADLAALNAWFRSLDPEGKRANGAAFNARRRELLAEKRPAAVAPATDSGFSVPLDRILAMDVRKTAKGWSCEVEEVVAWTVDATTDREAEARAAGDASLCFEDGMLVRRRRTRELPRLNVGGVEWTIPVAADAPFRYEMTIPDVSIDAEGVLRYVQPVATLADALWRHAAAGAAMCIRRE